MRRSRLKAEGIDDRIILFDSGSARYQGISWTPLRAFPDLARDFSAGVQERTPSGQAEG